MRVQARVVRNQLQWSARQPVQIRASHCFITHLPLFLVCETDQACSALFPPVDRNTAWSMHRTLDGQVSGDGSEEGGNDTDSSGAVCYKGGFAVKNSYQMCNVTS